MTDLAFPIVNGPELRAAASALRTIVAQAPDALTPTVELEGAVCCLFELLHHQQTDLGWKPSGLTLAPWAVEVVARLLARQSDAPGRARTAGRELPRTKPRAARARLQESA